MTRLGPLLAAALAAVAVLSACDTGDDPGPNFSSVSTTASISPTPSSTTAAPNTTANVSPGNVAPTLPAQAQAQTANGALAYAGYFWQSLDWAYATNDSSVIEGLYASSCKSCSTFASSIATDVGAGYVLIGGRIAIKSVTAASLEGGQVPAQYAFDVEVAVGALEERDSSGTVATSFPESTSVQRTYTSWADNGWQVVNTAPVQR